MSSTWRIGVLGLVFSMLLALLTLRLWTIQVTAAAQYGEQAAVQQIRIVETPAPRGEIRDRNGVLLAGTRPSLSAVVDRALVPTDREGDLVQRLSAFLGLKASDLQHLLDDANSGARIILASDLSEEKARFLAEHREDFPGVSVVPQPVRVYPQGPLAAHVIGYIGAPDEQDLEDPAIGPTDSVGKAGVERQYDAELRGTPGVIKYRVDARRNVLATLGEQPPAAGGTLILTLDTEVQRALETSLAEGLDLARNLYRPGGCRPTHDDPGCPIRAVGVVLDPRDGSVLAMASEPSFDPTIFVDGLTEEEWASLSQGAVFNNFAIQGVYPPASTFKTVAYVTALEETIFPEDALAQAHNGGYFCDGQLEFKFTDGSRQVYNDWKRDGHGLVDIHTGLQTSCDLYFWEIALRIWNGRQDKYDESLLQNWARAFGFDQRSGIDLPFEKAGLIPDRAWFEKTQRENPGRVREGPWVGGDLMNTVIGQGEVLVTPLQLANAYAAMVNGGTLYVPRVVERIVDAEGDTIVERPPKVANEVPLSDRTVRMLREDLRLVVNGDAGTARTAFASFGDNKVLVGGKTGTAEVIKGATRAEDVDTAWFVGVAPINDPRYVVAVVVERGGSGGRIAAPIARQVLQYLVNGPDAVTPLVPGESAD